MRQFHLGCAASALALALCGCGGGFADSAPPAPIQPPNIPPPATSTSTQNFDTQEYQDSTSAKNTNAVVAWQNGATGKGIKIGFVDSGLVPTNPDFVGKIDPASTDLAGDRPMGDDYGHGTALASIAAAAQNGYNIEGVAYDATIVMMKIDNPGSCHPSCSFDSSNIAQGINGAARAGAKVINLSLGGGDITSDMIDAVKNAAQMGVVFVVSAANDSASQPSEFARALAAAAPGQVIIAGALGRDAPGGGVDYNQLSTVSNQAGSFEDWYLGAPGYLVRVAWQSDNVDFVSGTSFSAPAIAGAVALLLQAFPNLTPQEVVQILLTTADDLGASGTDTVYGRGRLNIGNAFKPIGATALAGSKIAISPVDNGSAPAASGDALEHGSLKTVILDAYSRAFTLNLARTVKSAAPGRPLERALDTNVQSAFSSLGSFGISLAKANLTTAEHMGFTERGVGPNAGVTSKLGDASIVTQLRRGSAVGFSTSATAGALEQTLAGRSQRGFMVNQEVLSSRGFGGRTGRSVALRHDLGLVAFSVSRERGVVEKGYVGESDAHYQLNRVSVDKRFGRAVVSLGLSRLSENGSVLGGRLSSVFGTPGAKSLFIDAGFSRELGQGWSIDGNARRGSTVFASGTLVTSAYSLGLTKLGLLRASDELDLLVSQPLRVEKGGLNMKLPGGYDYASKTATLADAFVSLAPTGRELVTELGYTRRLPTGRAGFNVYVRGNPGHVASARPDVGAALRLSLKL